MLNFISRLAKEGGIDNYSCQFEVMLEEAIRFSNATGIAINYCQDGVFSMRGFEKAWRGNVTLNHIRFIAACRFEGCAHWNLPAG